MSNIFRFIRQRSLSAALLLACVLAAAPLHAQQGSTTDEGQPWVDYRPMGATFTTVTVPVTLEFMDDSSLVMSTKEVRLNDSIITDQFTFSTPALVVGGVFNDKIRSRATALLTLPQIGENVLSAQICDLRGQCTDPSSVTFIYAPGQQGVVVTPNGGTVQAAVNTTGTKTFYVKNTWSLPSTFSLQATCREAWTGASITGCSAPSSVTVNAGDSAAVTVSFPMGSTGGREMVVRLAARNGASVEDAGWVDVTTTGTGGTQVEPLLSRVDLNQGKETQRSDCVTVAVAPGAAYECGDLRVVHALPAHRTHGRTWAPVLSYNSQHAHPMPTVYADVTVPSNGTQPDSVQLTVTLSNGTIHRARFPGSEFTAGVARRVAVQWDGLNVATGEYPYSLQATSHYGTTLKHSGVFADTLVVVNRQLSGFGAGWWISGWESLKCLDCSTGGSRMLWIGGDGSTRVYEPLVSWQSWVARDASGPPDTLRLVGGTYIRTLPGGGRIEFDGIGVHVRTVNRLGQTTTFAHTGGRLDTIRVPVPSPGGPRRWVLLYTGSHVTFIQTLGAGANRQVQLGYAGGGLPLTAIYDADGKATHFQYPTGTYSPRMTGMVTRDSARYVFGWDGAKKLSSTRLLWNGTSESADDIVQQLQAAESRGVAPSGGPGTSVAVSQAYTKLDGPRDDVADQTYLWVTNRGAPRRIRNPEGAETILNRTNASFPGLVTQVRGSNARGDSMLVMSTAIYNDTTALLLRSIAHNPRGDLRNDTTMYTWDVKWRRPITIRQRSQGDQIGITTMAYDSLTGNLRSQLVGTASRRVWYDYYTTGAAAGQLAAIRYPHPTTGAAGGGGVDSLYYDGLGNLIGTRNPLGFRTFTLRDALGRDSISYSPIDSIHALHVDSVRAYGARSHVTYNVMDQPIYTVSHGPQRVQPVGPDGWGPRTTPVEEVAVATSYDRMGRVLAVTTTGSPISVTAEHEYQYDRAGRKVVERTGGVEHEYTYDKSGNVVAWTTPIGPQITTQYDVMGRPIRKTVPGRRYFGDCLRAVWTDLCYDFPHRPNFDDVDYVIPPDTTFYQYDLLGRMVYARNNDGIVERSYYPNGALRTDTLRMREYGGALFDVHTYGLRYEYDRMNRVSRLWHPLNLTYGVARADTFAYDSITGALSYAKGAGADFYFYQDLLGRPRSVHAPGVGSARMIDSTVYDIGGRVVRQMTGTASDPDELDYYETSYDARGKRLQVTLPNAPSSVHTNWYSGLGNLVATEWDNVAGNGVSREEMVVDPLGNIRETRVPLDPGNVYPHDYHFRHTLDPVNGRVTGIARGDTLPIPWSGDFLHFDADSANRVYDNAGNMILSRQSIDENDNGIRNVLLYNYFGIDGRLHATQRVDRSQSGAKGVWEEYRYDPLGRRILVRAVKEDLCEGSTFGGGQSFCQSTITRYVWAGDQILWEMRVAGEDTADLEKTAWSSGTPSAIRFGRVSYLHAGGIDRPLAIAKEAVGTVVPHQNWRGMFAWGTWASGTNKGLRSDCLTAYQTGCMNLAWPGWQTSAHHKDGNPGETEYWMGSLVDGMRDASGQIYMRNRYYDPATGQFTQQDPIGLAGGLNAYGFANGDPVSYSDPYGLAPQDVFVSCRPVENNDDFGHCAVRVVNEKLNVDVTYELLSTGLPFLDPQSAGQTSPDQVARYENWVQVDVPAGQTSDQFDLGVLEQAESISRERDGRRYIPLGGVNSNRFVYDIVTRAGGQVPFAAGLRGRSQPGLCGGHGIIQGFNCKLPPANWAQ